MNTRWEVKLSPAALEDYARLDGASIKLIDAALEKLVDQPELRGYPLRGDLAGHRSLVVGKKKYRIIYTVENDLLHVHVITIGHRRDDEVYTIARTRAPRRRER